MEQQVGMYKDIVAHTFNRVGCCFFHEGLYQEALSQHNVAVQLTRNMKEQEIIGTNIATYFKSMGKCISEFGHCNIGKDLFSKAANMWNESEHQLFLSDIDECNDYMRQCKFSNGVQMYGERFVKLSHTQPQNPEIFVRCMKLLTIKKVIFSTDLV